METPSHRSGREIAGGRAANRPSYKPPIHAHDVFHRLILDEIRAGRMTATRRRQILRYARDMRYSSREIDRLIVQCREEARQDGDSEVRERARAAVCSDRDEAPRLLRIANTLGMILVGYLLLLRWLI